MSIPGLGTGGCVSPSASPSSPSPSPTRSPDDDGGPTHPGAEAKPSPWFNRLTFSVGLLPPVSPEDTTPTGTNTTQTISLYFDAGFVPQNAALHAVFGPQGFVSCTPIPPTAYTRTPFTPYTAVDSSTVIDFARPPRRGSFGSVRRASVFCCALFLLLYTAAVLLLFSAIGRTHPDAPLPVLSSPLPLQANITRILRLHDEALVPIVVPDDHDDDDDDDNYLLDPHARSNRTSVDLIDSLYKEISNFCLLIQERAPDIEAVQYINRVCGWAHEATSDLRHAWLRAVRFHSDSMSITTLHWARKLASALRDAPSKGTTDTNTSIHVLNAVSRFLDPGIEQGLLPRSLQKGHVAVEAVLAHLDALQGELDRLVVLADEHSIQPDANAQPPPLPEKPGWAWSLLSRDVRTVVTDANWTDAAIRRDKVLLAVHASRALAQLVQAGDDAIAAMKPKLTGSAVRFREAEEALNTTSDSLRVLLETLRSDRPSVASSKWPWVYDRAIDRFIQWASSLMRGPPRQDRWQLGTPWLTCGTGGHDCAEHECVCAACWTLWYVPSVDGTVDFLETRAREYAV